LQLPYNAVAREDSDGHIVVGFMDPVAVLQLTRPPEIGRVTHEVRQRLARVRSALMVVPTAQVSADERSPNDSRAVVGRDAPALTNDREITWK
jgi:hypothetical protein